jgi:hypothetical protein
MADPANRDRDALIEALAATLQQTSSPHDGVSGPPSDDDRERAAQIVTALERLSLFPRASFSRDGFAFFRHPLVVGAGIAVISALFASLLIPNFTRVSADRPKELQLKRGVVVTIETSSAQALTRGLALARSDVVAAGGTPGNERVTVYRRLYGGWLSEAGTINAELFTYFPATYARGGWKPYEKAIRLYLRFAGITDPKVRKPAAAYLRSYLRPDASSTDEYRAIYGRVPWDTFAAGTKDPQSSIESILNLLLAKEELIVAAVAHAQASGFKHSVWSLG